MGKTITIEDDVYKTLRELKQGPGDSFTKVLRRHVVKPCETAGELLEAYEKLPPPNFDPKLAGRYLKQRGRRSGGRK
jgi:predicted CopG family antitoxin